MPSTAPEGPSAGGALPGLRPRTARAEGHSPHDGQPGDGEHEGGLVVVDHVLRQVPAVQGPGRGRGSEAGQAGGGEAAAGPRPAGRRPTGGAPGGGGPHALRPEPSARAGGRGCGADGRQDGREVGSESQPGRQLLSQRQEMGDKTRPQTSGSGDRHAPGSVSPTHGRGGASQGPRRWRQGPRERHFLVFR